MQVAALGHKNRRAGIAAQAAAYTVTVVNVGSLSYTMTGTDRNGTVGSGNNPSLTFKNGDIVDFVINATGHPFWIKTASGTGTANGAPGVNMNNGLDLARIRWIIGSAGTFYYNCQFHITMAGTITVNP
jgi:plastocyanin